MKIIVQGYPPEETTYQATCPRCKCIFEFQEKEARRTEDQREGPYLTVACPTCSKLVTRDARP